MRTRRSNSILMIIALAAVLLIHVHSNGFQEPARKPGNGLVTWYVELDGVNHNYVEVRIDTLKVHPESSVQEVFFDVDFHYTNGVVKTETLWFTNDDLEELSSGYIHRTWRAHSRGSASYATGACLYYAIGSVGLRQANPTRYFLKSVNPALKGRAGQAKTHPNR